jgi:RNA recognition motif-containing protein
VGTRLYVGNIPYSSTEEQLRQFFSEFGQVTDVAIVTDRETGRPRGFAFVSFENEAQARAAEAAAGRDLGGRPLVVKEARERGAPPPPRGEGDSRGSRPPRERPPQDDRRSRDPDGPHRGGGPSGPAPSRPPRGPAPGPPPEDGFEELREQRRRQRSKKKSGAEKGDRGGRTRPPEEDDEPKGGANWRHWLDEAEE